MREASLNKWGKPVKGSVKPRKTPSEARQFRCSELDLCSSSGGRGQGMIYAICTIYFSGQLSKSLQTRPSITARRIGSLGQHWCPLHPHFPRGWPGHPALGNQAAETVSGPSLKSPSPRIKLQWPFRDSLNRQGPFLVIGLPSNTYGAEQANLYCFQLELSLELKKL